LFATGTGSVLVNNTCFVPTGSSVALGRQGDRTVLSLSNGSPGVEARWGPLSGSWTLSAFVRLTSPVTTFGNYQGVGPVSLAVSGGLVVMKIPTGGSITSSQLARNGGPIDGVLSGWPWDAAMINQWRNVTVVNNTDTGVRTTYVDGCAAATEPASTATIPADTAIVLLPQCSASIAEFSVWNTATFTSEHLASLVIALRTKWDVNALPEPVSTATPVLGPTYNPVRLDATLPINLPVPHCWLDVGAASAVFADVNGNARAGPYQNVRLLRDRGSNGCHCTFAASQAVWATGAMHTVQKWPVLIVTGAGSFVTSPLQGLPTGGGYTIVTCHRYVDGGHPFAASTKSVLGPTKWDEYIGTNTSRSMPATDIAVGDLIVTCWHYTGAGSVLTHTLTTSRSASGYRWSRLEPAAWIPTEVPKVGANNKGLHLCELLVWQIGSGASLLEGRSRIRLTDTQLSSLSGYLSSRWGVGLPPATTPVTALPASATLLPTSNITPCGLPNNPRMVLKVGNVGNYDGPLFRLRRSTDNALANFYEREGVLLYDNGGTVQTTFCPL
jgi:hypothetical protein